MGILTRMDGSRLVYESHLEQAYELYYKNECLAKGAKKTDFVDPCIGGHPIFEVHYNDHIEYVREQLMIHTGIVNFRDLGGYYTSDGRQVRHGCFYRCAAFTNLNELHKEYIDSLHLHKIYDLRSTMEVNGNEDYVSKHTTYLHASALKELDSMGMKGNFDFSTLMQQMDLNQLKDFIKKMYLDLPIDNPAYKTLMADIINHETPIAFHCSAGKDRTGIASMIILTILGVDKKTIIEDYLLSNKLRKEVNKQVFESVNKEKSGMEALMLVDESTIQLCYDRIHEVYGDFDTYILQEYGIDDTVREQLKNEYLY